MHAEQRGNIVLVKGRIVVQDYYFFGSLCFFLLGSLPIHTCQKKTQQQKKLTND